MAIFKVTAVPDFSQLRGEIAKLQSSPVTLGVDTRQANVNIKATTQNLKKLTETFSPDGELVHSVSNYSKRVGEIVTVTKSLDRESGEMALTSKKVTQNFETQAKAAQKAAKEVQSASDAYRAYTAQQNKAYNPTAMQRRIEGVTGISGGATKSAEESAMAFEREWFKASTKAQDAAQKTEASVKKVSKETKNASGFAGLMGDSFGRVAAKMALWQVMGNAIAGVKRSFVEALDTMKTVDDEMVTIRKVTGASKDELEKIEKQAYKTASAYGVAAEDYLQFVSGFSRAGYGEQASALAELATKTQIVGDTTAETAQQFLLSVDAAYKYQGNIEKLTAVLDGANEIDNKYATSIQKIAEGLGKVAPIAAQAHVGVDELTAAIGTITAVTQRSGTEASTALRALFLNIIGDTKTEIDEGVTWTTGEIAGLRDVIKLYAKDAYDAAQASGDVINPMKAIAGLSKSMKDGFLTEQKLMEMVSDIGGKLRTSQLLALIQNWDMYESMLGDFANAAGSADKEVENALDSWTRKTEILRNKWTEFIGHLVETDTIKGALDGVIKLVEFLDSDTGRLVVQMGLLVGTLSLLNKGFTSLMTKTAVGTFFGTLTSAIGGNAMATTQLIGQLKSLVAILPQIGIGAAFFTALAAAIYVGTQKQREYNNALKETEEIQSKLGETQSEYDALINKTGELTAEEKKRLEVLKELRQEQEKQLDASKKATWEAWNNLHGSGAKTVVGGAESRGGGMGVSAVIMESRDVASLREYREELDAIEARYKEGGASAGEYYDGLQKLNDARKDDVETIREAIAAGYQVSDSQRELVEAYDRVQQTLGVAQKATKDYVSKLVEEARQSGATGKALYDLVKAQITASSTKLNFSQQMSALKELAVQAGYSASAIASVFAFSDTAVMNQIRAAATGLMRSGKAKTSEEAMKMARQNYIDNLWGSLTTFYKPSGGSYGGGSGSGGSGSSGSSSKQSALENAQKKAAQATIDAIRKQMKAETDAIDQQIDAIREKNKEEERSAKLEELRLDILKKQDALVNARNERTVRQYNAATGQWEWVADPEKVKKAQEDLENAKKDLRDYEADVEREIAISELEARKKAIEAAYQLKIDGWQKLIDRLNGDVVTESALLAASKGNWDAYYQEMLKVYQGLIQAAEDYQQKIEELQQEEEEKKKNDKPSGNNKSNSSSDIKTGIAGSAPSAAGSSAANPNLTAANDPRKNSKPSTSSTTKKPSGSTTKPSDSGGRQQPTTNKKKPTLSQQIANKKKRDSGGLLQGLGYIKDTVDDEMVLPPDITRKLVSPVSEQKAMQVIYGMRAMLSGNAPVGQSLAGRSDNRSYSDHSGDEYHIGNVTLSQQQAEGMTVAELCRMAHHVKPYGG